MNAVLSWTGFQNNVFKSGPLQFRLRSGIGLAHDVYGVGGYPNQQPGPQSLWYKYAGIALTTTAIKLPHDYYLTAQYDRQRTWYSVPHHVDLGAARVSVSRDLFRQHVTYYVAYDVRRPTTTGVVRSSRPTPQNADNLVTSFGTFSGQSAFRGLATSRGLSASLAFHPTQYFAVSALLSRFYDTPAPVPGAYGQPPVQITGDIRMRLSKQVLLDLTRSYYFNFADQRWTPQFGIQFSP